MGDQGHFEKDQQKYGAFGLVTRRQFGVMLGAGMAMMLPQVADTLALGALRGQDREPVPIPGLEAGVSTTSFALRNVTVIDVMGGEPRMLYTKRSRRMRRCSRAHSAN